jgi:hypothetical protein
VEDLGLDERITLKWVFTKRDWGEGMDYGGGALDYVDMAEDRGSWPALVNAVMKFPIS